MASEAISSSIMIIGAVLGAAVLITAILPAIFSAGDTFGTVSSSAEQKLRTDFRIVNTYTTSTSNLVYVWMKNVGSNRISANEIEHSDVFIGLSSDYGRYDFDSAHDPPTSPDAGMFNYDISGTSDDYWDIGETVEIIAQYSSGTTGDNNVLFTFALPNSVRRSVTFSRSDT